MRNLRFFGPLAPLVAIAAVVAAAWCSEAAATIFPAEVSTLPYSIDSEGGFLTNNVVGDAVVGPLSLGSGDQPLVLEFLPPSGQQFRYDSTAYNGGAGFDASLSFIPLLFGADPTGITGSFVSAELINPSGTVALTGVSSGGLEYMPVDGTPKDAFRFNNFIASLTGVGNFEGFRFTYSLSGASDQSMTFQSQEAYPGAAPPFVGVTGEAGGTDAGAVLTFTAVPEPASAALLAVIAGSALFSGLRGVYRRRG